MKSLFFNKSIDWVVLLILGLFLILSPSSNILSLPNLVQYDNKRIIEVCLIYLCFFSILFNSKFKDGFVRQFLLFPLKTRIILFILLILSLLSSFFSALPYQALLEISLYIGLLCFALVIANIAYRYHFFQAFFLIIVIVSSIFYQTTFFVAYIASFIENIPLVWDQLFGGFSNIRFFNQYQIWMFYLISLPLLIYPQLPINLNYAIKIITIASSIMLFVSGSRGAILAIIISLIITFIIFKKQAWCLVKLNILILIYGFFSYLILFEFLPYILKSNAILGLRPIEYTLSDNARLSLWGRALSYVYEAPLLGIGPMHYAYYYDPIAAHPHSSFLQWGAEMGVPSLILITFLVIWGLFGWCHYCNKVIISQKNLKKEKHLYIALFCTMMTGLTYSLVSGVIVSPISQILMMTIVGWMMGLYFQNKKRMTNIKTKTNLFTVFFIGTVLVGLTYTIMPTLLPRLAGINNFNIQQYIDNKGRFFPRFWQRGEIGLFIKPSKNNSEQ